MARQPLILALLGAIALLSDPAVAQMTESGMAPTFARGSAASFYYIGKPGELTMQVNLWGAVKSPGRYEVPSSTDLVQLLSYAGGPLESATLDEVKITRFIRRDSLLTRGEYHVDLQDLSKVEMSKLALQPGDTIFIDYSSWETVRDAFIVVGVLATVTAAVTGVIRVSQ